MSTTTPASAAPFMPQAEPAQSVSVSLNSDSLHVVIGTGQVGLAVTARLAELGFRVRAVSRHRPAGLRDTVGWSGADVLDADASLEAVKGAAVIYQCLNAPYTKLPAMFPPLQHTVLRAAAQTGAPLGTLENVYRYGPTDGQPIPQSMPPPPAPAPPTSI